METKTITPTKIRTQHDSIWKQTLEIFFPEFVHFCLPELASLIDWTKPWTALDKELHSITKGAKVGNRIVDKLFKVYLKNGQEQWVLLHIELQSSKDNQLPERVFVYSYRLYDTYLIKLPEELEEKFNTESIKLEGETKMTYITSFERVGIRKGIAQGRQIGWQEGKQEGEVAFLTRLLKRKFGSISNKYLKKIRQADVETLLLWGENLLDANTIEEIFA